jgi:Ser/Thr protein kinase RdoA (MazF antagonist)
LREDRLREIHALQHRLQECHIPNPPPRLSIYGQTYEFIKGRLVEVCDYLPQAAKRHWTQGRWAQSFAHMAQLHQVLDGLGWQITPPTVSNYASTSLLRLMLRATAEKIAAHSPSPEQAEALAMCQEAERLRSLIETRLEALNPKLPSQLIHGDFHLDNLLFDAQESVTHTLDFDFLGWRERVYEIAYALRAALPQLTDNLEGRLDAGLIGAWLRIYNEHSPKPLTPAELTALPYFLSLVLLYFIAQAGQQTDPQGQVLREGPYLELACYLVNYPDSLWERG